MKYMKPRVVSNTPTDDSTMMINGELFIKTFFVSADRSWTTYVSVDRLRSYNASR